MERNCNIISPVSPFLTTVLMASTPFLATIYWVLKTPLGSTTTTLDIYFSSQPSPLFLWCLIQVCCVAISDHYLYARWIWRTNCSILLWNSLLSFFFSFFKYSCIWNQIFIAVINNPNSLILSYFSRLRFLSLHFSGLSCLFTFLLKMWWPKFATFLILSY